MSKKITFKSVGRIFKKTIEPNIDGPSSIIDLNGSDNMIWDARRSNIARVVVNSDLSDLKIIGQKEGDVLVLYVNTILGGNLTLSRYNNVRRFGDLVEGTLSLGQGHYIISMIYLNGKFNVTASGYVDIYTLAVNVLDTLDDAPIADATVTLLIEGVSQYLAITDASGTATFYDVVGTTLSYDATITQDDYTSIVDGIVAPLDGQVEFTFELTRVLGDLTAYNAALAAVNEIDYTVESWAIYKLVVDDNVVTTANKQSEIDAATLAITEAQADLVLL